MDDTNATEATKATDSEETQAPTTTADDTSNHHKANAEAAKYRTRLREAETRAQNAEARLAAYNRHQAEAIAATRMHDPSDLWATGTTLDDLTGEDGTISAQLVTERLHEIAKDHPHWFRSRPPLHNTALRSGAAGESPTAPGSSWRTLLNPNDPVG